MRKGRSAAVHTGVEVGRGTGTTRLPGQSGIGTVLGGEMGDPLDSLEVYDAHLGTDGPPLWRGRMRGGLDGSEPKLVKEFRQQVEVAATAKP
ncbi:MAG: hypothetical protein ACE14L_15410 [Terriglobales bacterium]